MELILPVVREVELLEVLGNELLDQSFRFDGVSHIGPEVVSQQAEAHVEVLHLDEVVLVDDHVEEVLLGVDVLESVDQVDQALLELPELGGELLPRVAESLGNLNSRFVSHESEHSKGVHGLRPLRAVVLPACLVDHHRLLRRLSDLPDLVHLKQNIRMNQHGLLLIEDVLFVIPEVVSVLFFSLDVEVALIEAVSFPELL